MSFSFLLRTIYKTKSKISGEIVVKEQFGQYTLQVQNLIQSGGIIKGIWKKAFNKLKKQNLKVENVLLLGLGGGTAIQLIKEQSPQARIIGVEIDPEIIKIGKKYFNLNKIENLEIVNANAIKWIKNYQGDKFDLILVDFYLGGEFPQEAMSDRFLKSLKKIISRNGVVVFNWLKNKNEKRLFEKLEKSFSQVEKINTSTNLFFFCY